jgi:hypothetical protein
LPRKARGGQAWGRRGTYRPITWRPVEVEDQVEDHDHDHVHDHDHE